MLKTNVSPVSPRAGDAGTSFRFARFALGLMAYNLTAVLWGVYVRATRSGAGCGMKWPLCNGEVIPQSPAAARLIEFIHRATRAEGCSISAIFLATAALIGAALVLLGHVAQNASAGRAYSLSMHLINTLMLLACLTLTAWWAMGKPVVRLIGNELWKVVISVRSVVLVRVSGAITALGDTLFPVRSLVEGLAQDLKPAANIFLRLRWLHPLIATAGGAWLVYYSLSALYRHPKARLIAAICAGLVGIQFMA